MCRTVFLCVCVHTQSWGCRSAFLCVCVCVCVFIYVCIYCLGTNCTESTGSLFDWSCLKAGPLMNRSLSSRSGASEPLGKQQPPMRHNDRDGRWGACGIAGCFPSEPAAAKASHTEEQSSVCRPPCTLTSGCLYLQTLRLIAI